MVILFHVTTAVFAVYKYSCMQIKSVVDTYVACAYTENVFLHCWASVAWGTLMLHKINDLLSLDHFQSHLMVVLYGTKNYSFINV